MKDKKIPKSKGENRHSGRGGNNISLAPLTPEQAIKGMFSISKEDVKRITQSKPGNNKKPKS
jgi:hypothetical protein